MIDFSFSKQMLLLPVFEMGEYAGDLPRKFIFSHCLENKSNELKNSNTEETENLPDFPQRSESDVECGVSHESPEKRIVVDLQIMPVGEVHVESAEGVNVHNLTDVVENVQGDSRDDSQIIVSHSFGGSLDVLDDSGLRQIIENVPAEFGTVLV